jgi:hypothetical protein
VNLACDTLADRAERGPSRADAHLEVAEELKLLLFINDGVDGATLVIQSFVKKDWRRQIVVHTVDKKTLVARRSDALTLVRR